LTKIIKIEDYSFSYIGASKPAIFNIDLSIEQGEIVIIAGASGCGKTTLLRSFNGLIPHMYSGVYSGNVYIDNMRVSETPIIEIAKKVGYVFQNPENQIFMFSVEKDIAFGLENNGFPRDEIRERVDEAMDILKISNLAYKAPHELSDGQKQRVAIAGVLAMKPKILILDEPTSLLDPLSATELIKVVKNLQSVLGITVLIVEHRLDLLSSVADRVVVMNKGKVILDGPTRQVLSNNEALKAGIGIPSIIRLQLALQSSGLNFDETAITPEELSRKINLI